MKTRLFIRRVLVPTALALTAPVAVVVVLCGVLDAGYLHGPFIRSLTAHAGRKIQIMSVETHLLSRHPRVNVEHVTIGNPSWTPPGVTAEIDRIGLVFQLPGFGHSFGTRRLEIDGATLHLLRDATGHANWQRTDPDRGPQADLPLIRSLSMHGARVILDDALRHLQFDGTVSAQDLQATGALPPLRIEGAGELNGKAATFEITGDPLAAAGRKHPYGFVFAEQSSGSRLSGSGSLMSSFDFDDIDAEFAAAGEDLLDLYLLT
ncbi:MAG: AsmA family protein, partial [Steroidobacteraceae bacterium]